jgi:hypothetical protein
MNGFSNVTQFPVKAAQSEKEYVQSLLRADQIGRLSAALIDCGVSLPSEARFDATTMVLRKDDNRMEAIEWLVARKLVQVHTSGLAELSDLSVADQAMWLWRAQEVITCFSRCLEDLIHPDTINAAHRERILFNAEQAVAQSGGAA